VTGEESEESEVVEVWIFDRSGLASGWVQVGNTQPVLILGLEWL